jgi:hypothetical protein
VAPASPLLKDIDDANRALTVELTQSGQAGSPFTD